MLLRLQLALLLLASLSSPAIAQQRLNIEVVPAPTEDAAISLETGGVPGMPRESWFLEARGNRAVRNVSRASLIPFLPVGGKSSGAAVIILPGGGFNYLAMENEGWAAARWLADRGVTAFVLKYRLNPTPAATSDFEQLLLKAIAQSTSPSRNVSMPSYAVTDARAALALVRSRAPEWHLDPNKVGLLGFSAGAMTSLATVLSPDQTQMPSFLGYIYGPVAAVDVPANAPPLFLALANDDPMFGKRGFGLAESWQRAGKPVELHVYQRGGHGYGLGQLGTTTENWIEGFYRWLGLNGQVSEEGMVLAANAGKGMCPSAVEQARLFEDFTTLLLGQKNAREAYERFASPEMIQRNLPFGSDRSSTIKQWETMTALPSSRFEILSRTWAGDTATVRFRGELKPGQPGALVTQTDRFACGKIVEENASFKVVR